MKNDRTQAYIQNLPNYFGSGNSLCVDKQGAVVAKFLACQLTSVFQPIRHAQSGVILGQQAFVRSHYERKFLVAEGVLRSAMSNEPQVGLSPWGIFSQTADDSSLVELDRLCRTLHTLNYYAASPEDSLLFLSVHERLVTTVPDDHGHAFKRVLASLGVTPSRVVTELPKSIADRPLFAAYIATNYRSNGFGVALNVNTWDQVPALLQASRFDYLKVDASQLPSSVVEIQKLSESISRSGARLIVKRIESEEQLVKVQSAGIDLAQGYILDAVLPLNRHPANQASGRAANQTIYAETGPSSFP